MRAKVRTSSVSCIYLRNVTHTSSLLSRKLMFSSAVILRLVTFNLHGLWKVCWNCFSFIGTLVQFLDRRYLKNTFYCQEDEEKQKDNEQFTAQLKAASKNGCFWESQEAVESRCETPQGLHGHLNCRPAFQQETLVSKTTMVTEY